MKLKKATLFALISVCILLLCNFVNLVIQFADVSYSDGLMLWYKVSNIFYLLAWIGISIFFYSLYKNQK